MAHGRRHVPPVAVIVALSLLMAALAVVLSVAAVPGLPSHSDTGVVPWFALVPLFVLAERAAVHLRVGRSAYTFSFGHMPIVLAATLLNPPGALLAILAGSALTLALRRPTSAVKLLFNVALWSLEAAVAVSLYGWLARGADPVSAAALGAAFLTMVVTDQVSAAALTAAVSVHEGRLDRDGVRESVTWGLFVAVANTATALLAVVVLDRQPAALAFLLVLGVVLYLSYRAYESLSVALTRLQGQHDLSQALAEARGTDGVIAAILDRTRTAFEAESVELHLPEGSHRSRPRESGPAGAADPAADLAADLTGDPTADVAEWRAHLGDAASALVQPGRDDATAALLAATGATECIAALVDLGQGAPGVLVVADRLGSTSGFSPRDLTMLETVAGQAGTALANARLVDRLRDEVRLRVHQAEHDSLTGLLNRRKLLAELRDGLAAGAVGIVLVDVDRFQEVNDALGHSVGGDLLRQIAGRLRACSHEGSHARISGDIFAVVVRADPGTIREAVARVAASLRRGLSQPMTAGGIDLHVECTLGSATAPHDGSDPLTLLQLADVAMHRAKERRSGYEAFSTGLDRTSAERLAMFVAFREAISDRAVTLAVQPLVHPGTRAVVGAEALARWTHGGRPVSPDLFVAMAETGGLIVPFTELVVGRALATLRTLRPAGLPGISVNLSPRLLGRADLVAWVSRSLADNDLPPESLKIEVTETALMADAESAIRCLRDLRDIGVKLSIDDYGTGMSSLAYLKRLPVHELKLDRAFVSNARTDPRDAAIVRSTVQLAHELGLTVVAEGIEDEATMTLMATWGCDVAQGYYISRPMPSEDFPAWVQDWNGRSLTGTDGVQLPAPRDAAPAPVRATTPQP